MFERKISRGLTLGAALALVVAIALPSLTLAARGMPSGQDARSATAYATVSGNPLTIYVALDLSIQVAYAGHGRQVYPPGFDEADSGGFGWFYQQGNPAPFLVYAPDFTQHTGGTKVTPVMNYWTPGIQNSWGSGTEADPWWVETGVTGPATIVVLQYVRYVNGEDCFTVSYIIAELETASDDPVTFFQAADLYVDGDDDAYGFHDTADARDAVGGWNNDRTFLEYLIPVTDPNGLPLPNADHYKEALYSTIWSNIADGVTGFDDTIRGYPDWHDSGAGLQWNLAFPGVDPWIPEPPWEWGNNFVELAADWCFLEEEPPPPPEPTPIPPPPPPTAEPGVPEAATILLMGSGLLGLAGYASLRLRKK